MPSRSTSRARSSSKSPSRARSRSRARSPSVPSSRRVVKKVVEEEVDVEVDVVTPPPTPTPAVATPAVDDTDDNASDSDSGSGAPVAPPVSAGIIDSEEAGIRLNTLTLTVTFTLHLFSGLILGPIMLCAPDVFVKNVYDFDVADNALQFVSIAGAGVCCFSVFVPLMGLSTRSRNSLFVLLWLELFWQGACAVIAAKAYSASEAVAGLNCSASVPRSDTGEQQPACYPMVDVNLVVAVFSFMFFIAYAIPICYDDFSWVKWPRGRSA